MSNSKAHFGQSPSNDRKTRSFPKNEIIEVKPVKTYDRYLPNKWIQQQNSKLNGQLNHSTTQSYIMHHEELGQPTYSRQNGSPHTIDDPRFSAYQPTNDHRHQLPQSNPTTNVSVNNNGNYYRPWREELAVAFGKNVGNFFAFPIRMIGNIFEGIVNAGIGIVKMVLMAVIAPTLIYTGLEMYQASQNGESATAAAAQVGKQAVGLMGAVLGGMWDGLFGEEDSSIGGPIS